MSIKATLLKTDPKAFTPLLLRLVLAVIFFVHGAQKLFAWWGGPGLEGFAGKLTLMGMTPGMVWATVVALSEFVGSLLLALGLLTRVAAILIAVIMAVAIWKVHMHSLFAMEFPLVLLIIAIALAGTGAGTLSMDSKIEHNGF